MTVKLFDRFCDASHEVTSRDRAAVVIAPVSASNLHKTGVFRETAGDFPRFRQGLADRKSGDQAERRKSPDFRALEAQVANPGRTQDGLAGAGGFEPPNAGIKIRLIIQQFQGAFGKKARNAL